MRLSLNGCTKPFNLIRLLLVDRPKLAHHHHYLRQVSSYPNPLKYFDEYIETPMQPHQISGCNEAIIGVQERRLIRHHLSEDIRDVLVLRHDTSPVSDDQVYQNIEGDGVHWLPLGDTPGTLEGLSIVSTSPRHHGLPITISNHDMADLG